jgi:tetratricopeptide (TPR) repeat protein
LKPSPRLTGERIKGHNFPANGFPSQVFTSEIKTMRKLVIILLFSLIITACAGQSGRKSANTDSSLKGANEQSASSDLASRARELVEKGNQLYLDDRDDEAAAMYEEAIKIDPQSANAHYRLGLAYQALGKRDEAQTKFEKAVELFESQLKENPDDAEAQFTLGLAYEKLDKPESALKALKQAVKVDQENAEYFYELGTVQSRLAQYQEATTSLKRALELEPENYRAQEALESAQNGVERKQAALKQIELQAKKDQKVEKIKLPNSNLPPILKQK